MTKLIRNKLGIPPTLSLKNFYEKRNKILIVRETGGLGDILMHRMMFEDFKRVMPDAKISLALPKQYHVAVEDHPFIDEVLNHREVNVHDYVVSYNTTSACTRYEMRMFPFSGKHRSDIWANHCGVYLTKHNMHINLEDEYKEFGKKKLEECRNGNNGPAVLISPVSAMQVKNLTNFQLEGLVSGLRARGFFVYASHKTAIPKLIELNVPVIDGTSIREWMGVIDAADYVISVDTSTFHYAGGTGKPLLGIFTFADGKVYGRHYDFVLVQKHRDDGNWDCGPCYNWSVCPKSPKKIPKPCLLEITPQMILEGFDKMIKKWPCNVS